MITTIDDEITFRKLEIFLAFLEIGNLGRTAEHLGVSTTTVHRALHSLEDGLRCSLFRPEGRNLMPNDSARALAETSRVVLDLMAEGIRQTRGKAGYGDNRISIGSLYSLTNRVVPGIVKELKLRKPNVETTLLLGSNDDLLKMLYLGSIDAALLGQPQDAKGIESQLLFEDDIFFAAPANSVYAGLTEVDLMDCSQERFVSLGEGFVTNISFLEAFRIANFRPNVVMKTEDIFSLINLVEGGIGCTLVPGRIKNFMTKKVQLIPLKKKYAQSQKICVCFLRVRERDPNLLALLASCRGYRHEQD